MFQRESPMAYDTNAPIITGIRTYLRTHFPDVEFTAKDDEKTHSVILQADGRPPVPARGHRTVPERR